MSGYMVLSFTESQMDSRDKLASICAVEVGSHQRPSAAYSQVIRKLAECASSGAQISPSRTGSAFRTRRGDAPRAACAAAARPWPFSRPRTAGSRASSRTRSPFCAPPSRCTATAPARKAVGYCGSSPARAPRAATKNESRIPLEPPMTVDSRSARAAQVFQAVGPLCYDVPRKRSVSSSIQREFDDATAKT